MEDIYAGIVSYNPDLERLKENIDAISMQVKNVLVFDNGSYNQQDVNGLVAKYNNVELLTSDHNTGIATALNYLMQWGFEHNYTWMLSLDQDSVCNCDFVVQMAPYLSVELNLGIVAPVIQDRNVGVVGHNPKKEYAHVNTCITSGAISNIAAWKSIGEYDESMFIDSVDFEFCYRMRTYGYGVIQVSNVRLLHDLGSSKERNFLFWKIKVKGHSAFRKYYIARNNIYYPLKHHLWIHFVRGNMRNFGLLLIVVMYECRKKEKINAILKGWKDAYCKSFLGQTLKNRCKTDR